MTSLNDLPIGKKLAALLLLFILGLAAYIGFVFQTAMAVRGNSEQARNAWPLLLQAGEVGRATTEMRDLFTVAVTSQDEDMLFAARQQQQSVQDQVDRLADAAAHNGISLGGLAGAFRAYARAADAWAGAVVEGTAPPAQAQARLYELAQRQQAFTRELASSRDAINAVFASRLERIEADAGRTWQVGLFGGIALSLAMLGLNRTLTRRLIVTPLQEALAATGRIAAGDWEHPVRAHGRDEIGRLLEGMETLRRQLRARRDTDRRDEYLARLLADLHVQLRGDHGVDELCERWLRFLAPRLGVDIGLVYLHDGALLRPAAAYALRLDQVAPVPRGQSLVGQVARSGEAVHLDTVPDHYPRRLIAGGAALRPSHLAILPVHGNDELMAVLEFGMFAPLDDDRLDLLARCSEHFAAALRLAQARETGGARPAMTAVAS